MFNIDTIIALVRKGSITEKQLSNNILKMIRTNSKTAGAVRLFTTAAGKQELTSRSEHTKPPVKVIPVVYKTL